MCHYECYFLFSVKNGLVYIVWNPVIGDTDLFDFEGTEARSLGTLLYAPYSRWPGIKHLFFSFNVLLRTVLYMNDSNWLLNK